jgi:hypothetical protein
MRRHHGRHWTPGWIKAFDDKPSATPAATRLIINARNLVLAIRARLWLVDQGRLTQIDNPRPRIARAFWAPTSNEHSGHSATRAERLSTKAKALL